MISHTSQSVLIRPVSSVSRTEESECQPLSSDPFGLRSQPHMKEQSFSPPPGGDVDQGWAVLAVCWSFVALAFCSTVLRVWIRARLTRNLGYDDLVMSIAMVRLMSKFGFSDISKATTIIGASLITAETVNGLGRHEYYLTPKQRRNFQVLGWADWVQVFITLMLTKVSICLFLLRIIDSQQVKRYMYSLIGFMALFTAICVFLFLGVCRPLKAYWDVGVDGKCLSNHQVESIIIAQGGMQLVMLLAKKSTDRQ